VTKDALQGATRGGRFVGTGRPVQRSVEVGRFVVIQSLYTPCQGLVVFSGYITCKVMLIRTRPRQGRPGLGAAVLPTLNDLYWVTRASRGSSRLPGVEKIIHHE